MTIDEITEELKNEGLSPFQLAEFLTELAGWASYYGQQMKRIQLVKPNIWLGIQIFGAPSPSTVPALPKPLSDKKTEMTWATTEDGQKEIALTWELKRIDGMKSAIKQRLYVERSEYQSINQI